MDGPLVSVVITAFNAEATLRETLDSAAAQSWRNLEIIIVDDGSTDQTTRIAQAFCARESRARLIRQRNRGVAVARNRGISEARGEWVAPLDSDDLWHLEKIERQLLVARNNPRAGLVYCWSRHIDCAGRVIGTAPTSFLEGDILRDHLSFNFVGNGSTPIIRTDLLHSVQYNPGLHACADFLLQVELAMRTRFAIAPAYLTAYRITASNMSSDALRMIRDHIAMYRILLVKLDPMHRRVAARELARWQVIHGLVLLRRGMPQGVGSLMAGLYRAPRAALLQAWRQITLGSPYQPKMKARPFSEFGPTEPIT